MRKDLNSKTSVEQLLGEHRGIPSVNQTTSSTVKRGLIVVLLFVFCIIAGTMYWTYRRHIDQASQNEIQKSLHLTSAVPARTFIDLPTASKPIAEIPLSQAHPVSLEHHQHIASSPHSMINNKLPQTLDKAGSCLMATSGHVNVKASHEQKSADDQRNEQNNGMAKMLSSTSTPMRTAQQLGNRNFILAKGSFIDCALQTRLDSTVPGMTACVVTRNIYSDNGKVLLIERGSTISGEYKSNMRQGMARIFVLWTRIKTPSGVVVDLDSPGTDQLGGSGIPGYIDNHFWQRFGGALLLSFIDDAENIANSRLAKQNDSQISLNETTNTTQDMATEALKNTINIPPTLYKNQGEQVGIYVARDLDFSNVYDVTAH